MENEAGGGGGWVQGCSDFFRELRFLGGVHNASVACRDCKFSGKVGNFLRKWLRFSLSSLVEIVAGLSG